MTLDVIKGILEARMNRITDLYEESIDQLAQEIHTRSTEFFSKNQNKFSSKAEALAKLVRTFGGHSTHVREAFELIIEEPIPDLNKSASERFWEDSVGIVYKLRNQELADSANIQTGNPVLKVSKTRIRGKFMLPSKENSETLEPVVKERYHVNAAKDDIESATLDEVKTLLRTLNQANRLTKALQTIALNVKDPMIIELEAIKNETVN